jgi:hypothetical protein
MTLTMRVWRVGSFALRYGGTLLLGYLVAFGLLVAGSKGIKPIMVDSTISAGRPTWRDRVADWLLRLVDTVPPEEGGKNA